MKNNWFKRILCGVLSFILILGYVPVTAFAAEMDGLCPHHTQHTAECGYSPAVEGSPCTHVCTGSCYQAVTQCVHVHGNCGYVAAIPGQGCGCQPDENGVITHTEGCGYVEPAAGVPCGHVCSEESGCITKVLNCQHVHDDACGYQEAAAEVPCGYKCQECSQEEETTAPTEEETTAPTEEETTAPEEEQLQTIAFLEAEYREADSAYHYLLEAKEQETITLYPIPVYEGDKPLNYRWMQWDFQTKAFVPLELEEQPDALEITLPQGECLLTYACLVTAENAAGLAVFDVQVIGDQAASEDEGDESDESFELESSTSVIASGTCGENLTWVLDDTGLLTINGAGDMDDYAYLYDSWVPWEWEKGKIKSLSIDSGVTSIGDWAFYDCDNLTSITIPNSVTSIGKGSFNDCCSLSSIIIPDSVTSIGASAFGSCVNLTSITIPDSVTSIGNGVFNLCRGLTSITIPDSVTSIGNWAFGSCDSLTSITIPNSVTSIDYCAFAYCSSLTSITIPDSMTFIGEGAFRSCSSLASITIPDGVTSIGNDTFNYCASLTSVTIPDSVTSIGYTAFYGCTSLASVTIPDSVVTIDFAAFSGCTNLKDVYYTGSEGQWDEIEIQDGNEPLYNATIHFSEISKVLPALKSVHYLAFSQLVYENWSVGQTVQQKMEYTWSEPLFGDNPKITGKALYEDIQDWKVVHTSTEEGFHRTSYGFYAVAFQGQTKSGTEMVIAYRGSIPLYEMCRDFVDFTSDWLANDLPAHVFHSKAPQLSDALSFYYHCMASKKPTTRVSITGHSLGGGLASIVSMRSGARAEIFNAASFYESLHINEAITGFRGTDTWNILSHVVVSDILVGCYMGEYQVLPHKKYQYSGTLPNPGVAASHGLSAFLTYDESSQSAVMASSEDHLSPNKPADPWDLPFYLGTSGDNQKTCIGLKTTISAGVLSLLPRVAMYGGSGNDNLTVAGFSDDILVGGPSSGYTVLDGGLGNDQYYYCKGDGRLIIYDVGGFDTIYMKGYSGSDVISYSDYAIHVNGTPVITIMQTRSILGSLKVIVDNGTRMTLSGFNWSKIAKTATVACPVDVDILDADGDVVLTLQNNTEETTYTDYGCFYVFTDENGESIKYFNMVAGYDFRIRGVDEGTMDVLYCVDEGEILQVSEVPVTSQMTATITEDETPILAVDSNSDGKVDLAFSMGKLSEKPIQIVQEYITMPMGGSASLLFQADSDALLDLLQLTVESSKTENSAHPVITVDADGTVHAQQPGTAYVIASVTVDGATYSARCRVDVTEEESAIAVSGVQLGTSAVTTELYSTSYAQFDVILLLKQNMSSVMASANQQPVENSGVAVVSARFENEAANQRFELVVKDDRTLLVVPRQSAIEKPSGVGKSYSSRVIVNVDGTEFVTQSKLTLTVKKTLPKLKAATLSFNSFFTGQSQPIVITGATATSIERNEAKDTAKSSALPKWLTLSDGVLTLTDSAPTKMTSGSVYVLVQTQEWAVPVAVTVPVKVAYSAPSLKLSTSSVTFASQGSSGVTLKLLCSQKNETLAGLNVAGIRAPEGFQVQNLDLSDGSFTLVPTGKIVSGTKVLTVSFHNTGKTMAFNLKVSTKPVTLTASPGTVTLNNVIGDSAVIRLTPAPQDYVMTPLVYRLTDGKGTPTEQLDVALSDRTATVTTNSATKHNSTYKLYLSTAESKEVAVTIKTLSENNSKPTLTAKVTGAIDLSFPESDALVTPTFRNYSGGQATLESWMVTSSDMGDVTGLFALSEDSGKYHVSAAGELATEKTYQLSMTFILGDGSTLSCAAKLPVKCTPVKLKLSKTSLSLNKAIGEQASVGVSCLTKDYSFTNPILSLMDGTGKNSAEGQLTLNFAAGKLTVGTNENTKYGTTYKVLLRATKNDTPVTLTVKIPAQSQSTVSATLRAAGAIDVIRDSTAVTITPSYKNYAGETALPRELKIYSSTDGKNDGTDVTDQFRITVNDNGTFTVSKSKAAGAKVSTALKYRAVLSFPDTADSKSAYVALAVKTGAAKVTLSNPATLYRSDRFSRASFTITAADKTLNPAATVKIKDSKLAALYEIYSYGNGEFAIGFKDNTVKPGIGSKNITLEIFLDGNATNKPNATATLKLTIK